MTRHLWLPLNAQAYETLRDDGEICRCFHFDDWKALAIVHADELPDIDRIERFDEARKEGYHLINIPLSREELEQLPSKDGAMLYKYPGDVELSLCTQENLDRANEEAKKEMSP